MIWLKLLPLLGNLKGLFSKGSPLTGKLIVGLFLSVTIYMTFSTVTNGYYDKGYNDAVVEVQRNYTEALESRISSLKEDYERGILLEQDKKEIALRALQELREAPKEVQINEVIKIVENDDCKSLSDDYVGLLNGHYGEKP